MGQAFSRPRNQEIEMNAIATIATKMSPYASANVAAMLAGDESVATLHGARREIAAFADRLVGRNRRIPHSAARAAMIATARAAYDDIAGRLAAQGEL